MAVFSDSPISMKLVASLSDTQRSPSAGQGFVEGSSLSVILQPGTKIFDAQGESVDFASLVVGAEATIDGVVTLSDTDPDTLKASLIVLKELSTGTSLEGEITNIESEAITIATGEGDRCVSLSDETTFIEIGESENNAIELSDLELGDSVEVFGDEGSECFEADTVLLISAD